VADSFIGRGNQRYIGYTVSQSQIEFTTCVVNTRTYDHDQDDRLYIRSHVVPSWLWSYGSWICNYMCNQCLSPLKLWVRISRRRGVLDTTLCDKVCQW